MKKLLKNFTLFQILEGLAVLVSFLFLALNRLLYFIANKSEKFNYTSANEEKITNFFIILGCCFLLILLLSFAFQKVSSWGLSSDFDSYIKKIVNLKKNRTLDSYSTIKDYYIPLNGQTSRLLLEKVEEEQERIESRSKLENLESVFQLEGIELEPLLKMKHFLRRKNKR